MIIKNITKIVAYVIEYINDNIKIFTKTIKINYKIKNFTINGNKN